MKSSLLPEAFAVGLSGGADSTALLLRCLELPQKRVVAFHFNHGFEDENGDEAEAYCRTLCKRYHVPLEVGRCTTMWDHKTTKEVFARQQRFDFFKTALKKYSLSALLVAHHAGDRAENLVLRLARGSSLEGLVSFTDATPFPGWPEATIYRPLLDETHESLTQWLKSQHLSWIEDSSNVDTTIPRNAIRHHVRRVLPHFVAGANLAADILEEENAFLNQCVDKAILLSEPNQLSLREGTDLVLIRRALRRWLKTPLSYTQLQSLARLTVGQHYNLSPTLRVTCCASLTWQSTSLTSTPKPTPLTISAPGIYSFGDWQIIVGTQTNASAPYMVTLPLPLFIRSRQPGDRISPAKFKGSRKVQDVLTDLHIPANERDGVPLFFNALTQQLLYVPGLRPAAIDSTQCVEIKIFKV